MIANLNKIKFKNSLRDVQIIINIKKKVKHSRTIIEREFNWTSVFEMTFLLSHSRFKVKLK